MINKSFLKSSIVITIGGSLPMLGSILLLPFYANYLGDVLYTQVSFYISISLLFQILFSFTLEQFFGIKYAQLYEEPKKQKIFIGTTSLLLLFIGAGLFILTALFGDVLFKKIFQADLHMSFWPYGFFSVVTGFTNSYFKVATISLIYLKRSRLFFILNAVNFFATLLITIGGLYLYPGTIAGPLYGRLLSGLVIFCLAHLLFMKEGTFQFDKALFQEIRKFCEPFVFYALCGWVLSQIDRYMLKSYISYTDLNAYDLLLKCFIGIEFVQANLSSAFFPRVYEIWNKTKVNSTTTETNRYFNVFNAFNILLLILFCIGIPIVYKVIITRPTFSRAEAYIGILAAGFAIRGILNFYMITILYTKKINVLLKIFGVSTLFQVPVTFLAIQHFGLPGAIYAGLATKILQVILSVVFTRPIFKYEFNYFKIIGVPFLFIGVNFVQFLVFDQYNILFYLLQLVAFSLLFFAVFKNEIKKVLISFKLLPSS